MIGRFGGARFVLGIVVAWTAFGAGPGAEPPSGPPVPELIMSGLDNPRGIALGPGGALYVAEAGRGGTGPCAPVSGPGGIGCYGPTGAISRFWNGRQQRVLTGLPSSVTPVGDVVGPSDIAYDGFLGAFITIGLGSSPANRAAFGPAGKMFGTLVHAFLLGPPRIVADLAAYEESANPAGGPVDSNPFGLLVQHGARYVADAGGNSLLRVGIFGNVSTVGVLPPVAVPPPFSGDPVPTSIVRGPDGAFYVGQLTGAPFAAGSASVYRLEPGSAPTVYLTGFKTIIDLDFGPDGSLYVLEHASGPVFFGGPGRVVRVAKDGTRTFPIDGLTRPTSVLVDCKGTLYVTSHGVEMGLGEVWRLRGTNEHHHGGC
ncbi:MAG: ScyD/ScyE family protein [Vicinamibacterales bacterium]|nr:ScyD/ScyE family protein [Vicinamibacterales bacterium]